MEKHFLKRILTVIVIFIVVFLLSYIFESRISTSTTAIIVKNIKKDTMQSIIRNSSSDDAP